MSQRRPLLAAEPDIRSTALYQEIEAQVQRYFRPGSGALISAAEVVVSPDGTRAVIAGVMLEKLEGAPGTRLALVELATGDCQLLTSGPNTDRLPRWCPDGRSIAFVSDRAVPGNFQPLLLDLATREVSALPRVEGWVETLQWSPDGRRLLLGVAGLGAEVAGAQGGMATARNDAGAPAWAPHIEAGHDEHMWRRLWVADVARRRTKEVPTRGINVWEAVWAGDDAVVAICSQSPGEEAWYTATVERIELRTGRAQRLYQPKDQLGALSANRSGRCAALVEAVCSDRLVVAGDLSLIGPGLRRRRIDTRGVDVTFTQWQDEQSLLVAGVRAFDTVIGLVDARRGTYRELLVSRDHTCGSFYPAVSGIPGKPGECVFSWEGFTSPPALAQLSRRRLRIVRRFASAAYAAELKRVAAARPVRWKAPDGLEMHGWLLTPRRRGPFPLLVNIHGGPVWQWRPWNIGRGFHHVLALMRRGYAVFHPNPRGSSGRGQAFARMVFGDMGGADTQDLLSGVNEMVRRGIADPRRLAVTGGSYGGFMSSWLITQDRRFAAAVPIAPVTDWVSEHLTCHIPHFCEMFLADRISNPGGKYHARSPVMFAEACRTPTLNICGAMDHNTPPGQAMEFHRALRLTGCDSVLLTYPQEGHGIRRYPAAIDSAARIVDWLERHVPARRK